MGGRSRSLSRRTASCRPDSTSTRSRLNRHDTAVVSRRVRHALALDRSKPMPAPSLGTDGPITALDHAVSVLIDARADIFSSGMSKPDATRAGVMPTTITLHAGGGYITVG